MGPHGSTLPGPRTGRGAGLRQLAGRLLRDNSGPLEPVELAALVLPMVRRAVRTERGPAALVNWLRQRPGTLRTALHSERAVRRLTEDLVRVLFDPPCSPDDTLDGA